MSAINVVILAAGRGQRFMNAGITVPKPLITFRGRSLLQWTVTSATSLKYLTEKNSDVSHLEGRIIVVATELIAREASRIPGVTHVVPVSQTQPGPAASGLLALAHIPHDERVIFMDCDNFYGTMDWADKLNFDENFIVAAEPPKNVAPAQFCNIRVTKDGQAAEIREKMDLGPDALVATGIYGFAAAGDFRAEVYNMSKISSETPMSFLFDKGTRVVRAQGWLPLGTPEQLSGALENE